MEKQNDLLMDSSILYRSTQKYYDKMLQDLNLSYAQLPILIEIYENEGISLQQIVQVGGYDKGTVTKNVQKLNTLGYVSILTSAKISVLKNYIRRHSPKNIYLKSMGFVETGGITLHKI